MIDPSKEIEGEEIPLHKNESGYYFNIMKTDLQKYLSYAIYVKIEKSINNKNGYKQSEINVNVVYGHNFQGIEPNVMYNGEASNSFSCVYRIEKPNRLDNKILIVELAKELIAEGEAMLHYVTDDYHDYPTLMENSTKLDLYKTSNIDGKQVMFYKINNESDFPFLIILHRYESEGALQFRLIYKIVSSEDEYKPIEFLHSFSALRYGNSLNISFKEIFSLFG